jgi:hypothetical protein
MADYTYPNKNMNNYKNPTWWNQEQDSAWDRVKAAFKRDLDQTKHDMGGHKPDTNQNVKDTVKQASGTEAIPPRGQAVYEKAEPAYRFGYGARAHYGKKYSAWNADLENELKRDWTASNPDPAYDWGFYGPHVRSGWDYQK